MGSLAQFETDVITLPTFWSQDGTNSIEVEITTVNGIQDENLDNNQATSEFVAYDEPNFEYVLTLVLDDYEGNSMSSE